MPFGFYIIMAAQFFSSLADNALLIAAIATALEQLSGYGIDNLSVPVASALLWQQLSLPLTP